MSPVASPNEKDYYMTSIPCSVNKLLYHEMFKYQNTTAITMQYQKQEIPKYPYDRDLLQSDIHDGKLYKIYRLDTTCIVLGKASSVETELYLDKCLEDEIPLFSRQGGGCAVVIDPGNIIVSAVVSGNGALPSIKKTFKGFVTWIIDGLKAIGINGIYQAGYSDLVYNDRKIGGGCLYIGRNIRYYSTTILVEPDISLMDRYLKHPPREPFYRRKRSHKDFISSIQDIEPLTTTANIMNELDKTLLYKHIHY